MKFLFLFITTFMLGASLAFGDGSETKAHGSVIVFGESHKGKIYIFEDAAKKLFDTLPKGCQFDGGVSRFGSGLSCSKDSEKNSYECTIAYNQNGVFDLFGPPSNCNPEQ